MLNSRFGYSRKKNFIQGAKYWLYSVFEYYSNNILFVFVFGHNSEPEYYSYSYLAKYLCTNIIRIRIRSFWKNEYYSYSYSVKILIPNNIRIRSKKQYSLTSDVVDMLSKDTMMCWVFKFAHQFQHSAELTVQYVSNANSPKKCFIYGLNFIISSN